MGINWNSVKAFVFGGYSPKNAERLIAELNFRLESEMASRDYAILAIKEHNEKNMADIENNSSKINTLEKASKQHDEEIKKIKRELTDTSNKLNRYHRRSRTSVNLGVDTKGYLLDMISKHDKKH